METVGLQGTPQRAGDGGSPVQVMQDWISLRSCPAEKKGMDSQASKVVQGPAVW